MKTPTRLIALVMLCLFGCNSKVTTTQNTNAINVEYSQQNFGGIPDSVSPVKSLTAAQLSNTGEWTVTYKAYHPVTKVRYTYNYVTDSITAVALKVGMANGTIDSIFTYEQGGKIDFFKRKD